MFKHKQTWHCHTECLHDDVIKWKHFPRDWPFVRGIHRLPVNSPHKGQWHGALMFSLIWAWISGWVKNHEAVDLRRHRAHYDVTVMWSKWDDTNKNLQTNLCIYDISCHSTCYRTQRKYVTTLRSIQNGCNFPDDIFKCIFLNEDVWIAIKNSVKLVPKGPIDNIPTLVKTMAWRRSGDKPGDKPLSRPMLVTLLTHICVSWPHWFKWCWMVYVLWLHVTRDTLGRQNHWELEQTPKIQDDHQNIP